MWTIYLEGGPRRVNHAAVAIHNKVYSFGGYCSGETMDGEHTIDIHALNTDNYRWRLLETKQREYGSVDESSSREGNTSNPCPHQRYGHTVCVYNNKAYLWGGRNDETGAISDLHEFDPATLTWRIVPVTGRVPPARDGHTCIVVGDKMYMFGGFEEDTQRFSQETYVFDFETSRWAEMPTTGDPPLWRDFHTACEINNKMYIFGGRSDHMGQYHSTRDVYCEKLKALDLTTGEWTEPKTVGDKPSGRRSHSAWAYNGRMYIFGGYLGTKNEHYNDLYCFDPVLSRWSKINCPSFVQGPSPRRRQCTVLVGNKVFLFGGTKPSNGTSAGLSDLADLYVLDYSPSLFNLAAQTVIHNKFEYTRSHLLPRELQNELHYMTHPNEVTNPPNTRQGVAG